jgi:hypothetical protein
MSGTSKFPRLHRSFYVELALLAFSLAALPIVLAQQYPSGYQLLTDGTAVLVEDYASLPPSSLRNDGPYPPQFDNTDQLARPNSFRSEPPAAPLAAKRFFVVDQNGTLYILDKATKKFTPYIEIGKIYPKFTTNPVYGLGFVSIQFDPGYAKNGKFYTVHTEKPSMSGSNAPVNDSLPGLDLKGFTTTTAINSPAGEVGFESILTEWIDTNIKNSTFEGTSRELLRAGLNFGLHPMADMIFDPLARPGSSNYGNLYISVGDGTAGERAGPTHTIPQRLDALPGKILRITPDLNLRPKDMLSSNGRYRIPSTGPDPNPFISVSIARPEVFAYGLRNPHRLSWDPVTNTLIAADIGNHLWEEINIISKGSNYGWAEREGPEQTFIGGPNGGKTGSTVDPPVPFPATDTLVVEGLETPVTPLYPVAYYSHRDGVAMGAGFVYRGKLMPQLSGKYIFTEMTTGRLFYADLNEMIAAHGIHNKSAPIHEIQVMYKNPYDPSAQTPAKWRMYDIVAAAFAHKGGVAKPNSVVPGASLLTGGTRGANSTEPKLDPYGVKYGGGRADVRLARGGDGEIYALCKADGMIRKLVAVTTPPPAENASGATQ